MSTPFQNRLVGTVIVAAIAIIVLPDLLDGNKNSHQDEFKAIPKPPSAQYIEQEKSFPTEKFEKKQPVLSDEQAIDEQYEAEKVARAKSVQETEVPENKDLKVTKLTKPTDILQKSDSEVIKVETSKKQPEKAVLKEAWVIQLGSFRHKKNVEELLAKLKANGYTAFSKPIKTKNGTLTKVCVGPELIKSSLEKKISALKELTNVQGKIARFYPNK